MASPKGILANALGSLFLRDATVNAIEEIAPKWRRLTLAGSALRSATWLAGDKVQVLLPSLDMRTYTPTRWDVAAGETDLMVYHHGDSPGAQWSRTVAVGDRCRLFGPQRSLHVPRDRPVVLFGDETSFAVAIAIAAVNGAVAAVLEVDSRADSDAVFARIGLARATAIERRASDAHLDPVAEQVQAELARHPGAALLMTGRAQSIQTLRARLRDLGVPRPEASKAYWAVGKVGLD